MNTWILDAIDPLFFGDGRSIDAGQARSRILPPPQALAGVVRTRQGQDDWGTWVGDPVKARTVPVHGPFPALLDQSGAVSEWLFPRPADALGVEGGLRRLVPLDLSRWGFRSNLPCDGLAPTGLPGVEPSKPTPLNTFWRWSEMDAWLADPSGVPAGVTRRGIPDPPVEARMHVAIDPETGRAVDPSKAGALFGTSGRRMVVAEGSIGIGLCTDAAISEGASAAGGERRMVRWRRAGRSLPSAPHAVLESAESGAVRVVLATPALFVDGWRPERLFDAPDGSTLVAACVGRPEVVSGWDLAKGEARPSRRCAPAGSVYFLKLGGSKTDRREWAESAWLSPRSDRDLDRLDGFGCLLLGAWNGILIQPHPRT